MSRLWAFTLFAGFLALLFYGAGCTRRSIDYRGDGGTPDGGGVCSSRSIQDCETDTRCILLYGCCGGPSACVPEGTPEPGCTCPQCKGLDEKSCLADSGLCVADYCDECSCTPTFVGCRGVNEAQTACPPLGCAQPLCTCEGLSESDCLVEQKTLNCTPYYCPDCNGGQSFSECLGPNDGAPACANICPADQCHNQNDCTNGEICAAPDSPFCGGACQTGTGCTDSSACAAGYACGYDPCVCTDNGKSCIPGCAIAGCPEGQTCGSDDTCAPTTCGDLVDNCPAFFDCQFPPGGTPYCARHTCSTDGDCGGGYCVDGRCYSTLGTCLNPPG